MKLNPECVRAILLTVEEITEPNVFARFGKDINHENLSNYPYQEVLYHLRQCDYSGLFIKASFYYGGECTVLDLSPKGHEFLSNIRSDKNWNTIKERAKSIGSFGLDVLSQIASQVIAELITGKS